MPIININGGGRGPSGNQPQAPGNGMRLGPSNQIPYMRPDYDKAWNSNRPPSQSGRTDTDRAYTQKEEQDRRAAAAERQKRAQEAALNRQSEREGASHLRAMNAQIQAEIRQYEAGERAKAQARAKWDRIKRQDDNNERRQQNFQRAQEVGDARAMDMARNRRLREEASLARQFDNIQHRASRPLTASSYAGIQRQASLLQGRAAQYQANYGMPPVGLGGLGGVLAGMGTSANTYATQNILGLGGRGQRAAEGREWVGLARVEQELRRIERVNVAILANDVKSTAEQKANASRNIDAVRSARARIGAGRSGNSGMMNAFGGVMGEAGLLLSNPIADAAIGLGTIAATSPFLISGALNKAVSLSRPYYNLRETTAGIGRTGNFNSRDLMDRLLPTSGGAPEWMKAQGITTSMATGILGDYGIAPRSASEAVGIIRGVRSASLSRYLGLGDSDLASSAALARTLGVTGLESGGGSTSAKGFTGTVTAESDRSRSFATLQKVMASATSQGLDHAQALKNVEGLLRATAGAGAATVNAGAAANFWGRMTSSGLPGMRSGEGIASAMASVNQSFDQIGVNGNPAQNVMMMSYFNRHGGMPTTEAGLQKLVGMSDKAWAGMKANPGQAQMIKNYLDAAGQNPSMALTYLKPFLDGRPDLMTQIYDGSEFGDVKGPQAGLLRSALTTNNNYAASIALQTGKDLPKVTNDRLAFYRDRLSKDLGISRDAASGVVGNLYDESRLQAINEKGGGGFGWAQWTGSRRTEFEAYAKTHGGTTSDTANYGFLVQELQKPQFADVLARLRSKDITYADASDIIMKRYENPRDQSTAALAGRRLTSGMVEGLPFGTDNVPTDVYNPTVNADQAAVGASRYAANTLGDAAGSSAGDVAVKFSQGVDRAAVSLEAFISALSGATAAVMTNTAIPNLGAGNSAPWLGTDDYGRAPWSIPARP
jgi:hypothetical protein